MTAKYTFKYVCEREDFQQFPEIEYPKDKEVVFNITLDDGTRWDNVMLEFAKFLDAVGYVGVHDKVDQRISDEWEYITKAHEDISNT